MKRADVPSKALSGGSYRLRIAAFVVCAIVTLFVMNVAFSAGRTLTELNIVETERDSWQRPLDVVSALNIHRGSVVADVGCGSGYFDLKLSEIVDRDGKVLAEDIRWLPLAFLWIRTIQRGLHNVSLIHGDPAYPRLPANGVDAVLIANTYHELADAEPLLGNVYRSLRSNGRLVVLDRSPGGNSEAGPSHEIAPGVAEAQLRLSGFRIADRQEKFINRAGDDPWWLIVAVKN